MHGIRVLACACAATALIASCGGGGGDHFKADYQQVLPVLSRLASDIVTALQTPRGKSDTELETEFTDLAQRSGEAQKRLTALHPPTKNAAALDTVEGRLGKVQQDLAAIAAAARAHSASAARTATETLLADAATVKGAGDELKRELGIPLRRAR